MNLAKLAIGVLFFGVGSAEAVMDFTRLSLSRSANVRAKNTLVVRQTKAPSEGAPSLMLFEPDLPGMRKVVVRKKVSAFLYQDAEWYLYEAIDYSEGERKPRRVLQRLRNDPKSGVRGDFQPLKTKTKADLVLLFEDHASGLPAEQKPFASQFVMTNQTPP